jgi:hypothetical protein
MYNSYHRTELEQYIYDETYNWTIVEWRAFRNQFSNYYEVRNNCLNVNPSKKEDFNEWKLEKIIDFKVRNFDLRKEGTNG